MKNYKTTIIGVVLAILTAVQPLAEDEFVASRDILRYAIAVLIASLGYLSKDHDMTDLR
jgi:hypothetical protein